MKFLHQISEEEKKEKTESQKAKELMKKFERLCHLGEGRWERKNYEETYTGTCEFDAPEKVLLRVMTPITENGEHQPTVLDFMLTEHKEESIQKLEVPWGVEIYGELGFKPSVSTVSAVEDYVLVYTSYRTEINRFKVVLAKDYSYLSLIIA